MSKFFFLLLLYPFVGFTQIAHRVELTKTDITTLKKIDGKAISVYGCYLGMSKKDAVDELAKYTDIYPDPNWLPYLRNSKYDSIPLGIYIYKVTNTKDTSYFLLYWGKDGKGIEEITIFNNLQERVIGETKNLFTKNVVNIKSSFYKKYLGKPSKIRFGAGVNTYFYAAKNFEIITNTTGKQTQYYFKLTKKASG